MREQRVDVDSLEIHVESVGEGIPVVLIHGLGLSGAIWNRVRDSLGPGYRLVMIDLRGAGRTRELVRKELSLEQWAADLGALLAALEIERPVLVGHSLGASIALKYALEQPGDVRALVLIGVDANLSNLAPRMLASAERIEAMGMEAWVAEFWSANPPFSERVAAACPGDPRGVPVAPAPERRCRLRAPVPCDRSRGKPGRTGWAR